MKERKAGGDSSRKSLSVYLTDEEDEELSKGAKMAGLTKSDFARKAIYDLKIRIICFAEPDTEELREVICKLGQISEKLNEIKYELKQENNLTNNQETEINRCISDVFKLLGKVEKYGDRMYGRSYT